MAYCGTEISITGRLSGMPPSDTAQRDEALKVASATARVAICASVKVAFSRAFSSGVTPLGSNR
jgi:hypothetical protein